MIIKKRQKFYTEVLTIEELQKFILDESLYKYFIKFHNDHIDLIQKFIVNTEKINYKEVKPSLKKILQYPETIYDPYFLKCMGWNDIEAKEFISKKQKNNSNKLSELKKSNPEHYKDKTTTNIEYWLKKGLSYGDAKEQLKIRQSTFSLKKCIDKYGEEIGRVRFEERQNKWINTLKNKINYSEIQKNKNIFNYDKKDLNLIIKHSGFKDKIQNVVNYCIKNKNIDDFVDCIIFNDDIKRYNDITSYINSKIIQNHFKLNQHEIKDKFYKKLDINQNRQYYGICVYHNGYRYKSISEYRVALFLEINNVSFEYEKIYPNSKMKCDFYLKDYDIYVELYGLLNKKNLDKLDDKLLIYKNKMLQKNDFCLQNKINLIYDFDYSKLIQKLKTII